MVKATKKQEFPERKPNVEVKFSKSADGEWFITRTIITEIKSVNYIKEVIK